VPEEQAVPPDDDNVSHFNLLNGAGFNGKQVTGLDTGKHARALCPERNPAMIGKHPSEFQ
jgi:hypothetical protein